MWTICRITSLERQYVLNFELFLKHCNDDKTRTKFLVLLFESNLQMNLVTMIRIMPLYRKSSIKFMLIKAKSSIRRAIFIEWTAQNIKQLHNNCYSIKILIITAFIISENDTVRKCSKKRFMRQHRYLT